MMQMGANQSKEAERRAHISRSTHTITESAKIPENGHFAILVNEQLTYDDGYGDGRSPSTSTLSYMNYMHFDTEEALEAWILENHTTKKFRVVYMKPVEYELKTTIRVGEP